jgi:hypothetical protein
MAPSLIDLRKLSDDDLLRLNHEIIALLKARHRHQERQELMAFDPGDAVIFEAPEGGRQMRGVVIRVNQKSLTIATDGGTWRVAPCFVKKDKDTSKSRGGKLFPLRQPEG